MASRTITRTPPREGAAVEEYDLLVGGMTCGSCAARIQQRLNRLDGVEASVNFATERAHVVSRAGADRSAVIAQVERTGYTARELARAGGGPARPGPDEGGASRARLVTAAVLGIPVIVLAMVPAWQFPAWQWVSLVLSIPVVVWAGWPFHRAAVLNLRHGSATMDTLISLGTSAAFLWSVVALAAGGAGRIGMRHGFSWSASGAAGDVVYFEVAAGVTLFLLAGRRLETRAKRRAAAELDALFELGAREVSVLRGDEEHRVPVEALVPGDRFRVRPGEKVATDGEVVAGAGEIDAAMLTGEAVPVAVGPGDAVTGGTVNGSGMLTVVATRVGSETRLAQLAELVARAQSGKAAVQSLADRVSGVFVPVVIGIALAVGALWLAFGAAPVAAAATAVAVLIVACPCALGLATPTALLVGTGRGARLGILVKSPASLEEGRRIDTVVFDKTGTVTTGVMSVGAVIAADGTTPEEVLRRAAVLEAAGDHPIGAAVIAEVRRRGARVDAAAASDFRNIPGVGVDGVVDGVRVEVRRDTADARPGGDGADPAGAAGFRADAARDGATVVAVRWGGAVRGLIAVADSLAPTAADAVAGLRRLGLRVRLLTGDSAAAAARVGRELGIAPERVEAEVDPEGKLAAIRRLQAEGARVAMVGDGINDAAALAAADLGIAVGAGADAALEASDITIVSSDPRGVVDAIRLSRSTMATIVGNLWWAFGYNIVAIPLAAIGIVDPMVAGAAMAFSSVFVVLNSLRLRRFAPTALTPAA